MHEDVCNVFKNAIKGRLEDKMGLILTELMNYGINFIYVCANTFKIIV